MIAWKQQLSTFGMKEYYLSAGLLMADVTNKTAGKSYGPNQITGKPIELSPRQPIIYN
jgi:hypothetical protein